MTEPKAQKEVGKTTEAAEKGTNADSAVAEKKPATDWREAAWNQRLISRYGQILPLKAKRELEQLSKTRSAPTGTTASSPSANVPSGPSPSAGNSAADPQRSLQEALQRGIDLSPELVKHSDAASDSLDRSKPNEAVPSQEKALEVLKKMLPKEDKNKDDSKKDQKKDQQKQQDKKKDNKKDQDKKDQEKKNQDKKDQDKKDQDKKNEQKKDQEKKDQQKKDQQKKELSPSTPQEKKDPSKQDAEAALSRVRQRQEERKELEKQIQMEWRQREKVEKDW